MAGIADVSLGQVVLPVAIGVGAGLEEREAASVVAIGASQNRAGTLEVVRVAFGVR